MSHIHIQFYKNDYTEFILGSFNQKLCLMNFSHKKSMASVNQRIQKGLNAEFIEKNDDTLEKAKQQIEEYFSGKRKQFDLPLLTVGTEFQKQVWDALLKIPYGTTASYLQLAKSIKNPKAVRAVANANGANALSIIIPCHRIIGNDGTLVGYGGGLPLKKRLLDLEQGFL